MPSIGRVRSSAPALLGVAVLAGLSGCGPSNDAIAISTLVGSPVAYLFAMLALWGLYGLWRDRLGSVRPRWPVIVACASSLCGVAGFALYSEHFDAELATIAGFLATAISVALTMLLGRLSLRKQPLERDAGQCVALVPALVVLLVYVPFVLTWLNSGALEEATLTLGFVVVGFGGTYVAGPLILGLIVETVFARRAS